MEKNITGAAIHAAALEYGYDNCGVIPLSALEGYGERLREREAKIPESKAVYQGLSGFTRLQEDYPCAKSALVCTNWLGKYRFPKELQGKYAKSFLLSADSLPDSPQRQQKLAFEAWLTEQGVRFLGGETHLPARILPLRYAAVAAGLGIFRKNNFFYGEKGSYYELEGYLLDVSCEYRESHNLRPCADTCKACQNACKTHALCGPYTMNPLSCVSFWTTFGGGQVPPHLTAEQFGSWICGCDACQDACPYNCRQDWQQGEPVPEVEAAKELLLPENLLQASPEALVEQVVPLMADHIRPEETGTLRTCAARCLENEARA